MSTKQNVSTLKFVSGSLFLLLTNTQCDRTCGEPDREYEIAGRAIVEDVREWVNDDGPLAQECSLYL